MINEHIKYKESIMTKGITKFFMDAALFAGVASADTDLITNINTTSELMIMNRSMR